MHTDRAHTSKLSFCPSFCSAWARTGARNDIDFSDAQIFISTGFRLDLPRPSTCKSISYYLLFIICSIIWVLIEPKSNQTLSVREMCGRTCVKNESRFIICNKKINFIRTNSSPIIFINPNLTSLTKHDNRNKPHYNSKRETTWRMPTFPPHLVTNVCTSAKKEEEKSCS